MNMEKLSYSNEENCHKLVSTESFGMEAVSTWSVVVVLSCYLKVDEPKDYRKLNGKLLEDILELLGPQELVNVCLFWNAIVAVFPMAELNEEYGLGEISLL
ncbi:uncharacterized protein [Henckelia pumila]|uniref:uncharacterized protein n=1 Tax=Henckelia pumila TaxID=405737 RepID=UPI003C6E1F97